MIGYVGCELHTAPDNVALAMHVRDKNPVNARRLDLMLHQLVLCPFSAVDHYVYC